MKSIAVASFVTSSILFACSAMAQDALPEPAAECVPKAEAPVAPVDNRPIINKKSLKMRGYEVIEQVELTGFGPGWTAVLLSLRLPESETDALATINRLYILDGDRIEFDSFAFDAIEDAIEPSTSTRTFFGMKWEVMMKGKAPGGLVLTGIVPRQAPGDPVKIATRTLVLRWSKAGGFKEAADVISCEPARVSGGIITVPVN